MNKTFDVIVVGAGHAGIEAAHIAAKMNANTLLITLDTNAIGIMPCNPSIGGLGKGHIVYEVSALGGLMPKLCSKTYLQARMLNTSKGPAVQGLRLQIDKYAYSKLAQETLLTTKNLTLYEAMVTQILFTKEHNKKTTYGIRCKNGEEFFAPSIVITSGTFLNGVIHIGKEKRPGGKDDAQAVIGLTQSLEEILETKLNRLKTGTPPRLLRSSIDFLKLEQQKAHALDHLFDFSPQETIEKQPCFIAYTNEKTHNIIRESIKKSALFSGNITGIGPRYCPSIEDKITRFPNRTTHHIFIEPEGGDNSEVYPGGLSTSLPIEVQKAYINSITGLEDAIITKPGYAIEYDFLQPNNLTHTLEAKKVVGLFFAGQINGTTGYEEAAGQGIIAGINAVLKQRKQKTFELKRTESYIGVMIDDIISLGVDEPYRMFTSRAERRLLLRQDNVFLRIMPYAKQLGTIDTKTYKSFLQEKDVIEKSIVHIMEQRPKGSLFKLFFDIEFPEKLSLEENRYKQALEKFHVKPETISKRALLCIHAHARYDGYIEKERKEVKKAEKYHALKIPISLEFKTMPGLTRELQEKLLRHKPQTIAQAQLIPGMTPAAISLLIFQVRLHEKSVTKRGSSTC